jgi:hypothetical protein
MKPLLPVCERCGLREVRHELERKGIVVHFCDECYWGEVAKTDINAASQHGPDDSVPSGRASE